MNLPPWNLDAPPGATRADALARLEAFLPRAGARYAHGRNHDPGPHEPGAVSRLSPWLRHRLLTEHEVIAGAVAAHGLDGAEKFVHEVCWRTYFKGWLELRPAAWSRYRDAVAAHTARAGADRRLGRRVRDAIEGRTGIDCLDAWSAELVDTGYLHNHTRMWFASIWIFTLDLPWALGADFFARHLLDGDPASNTLSWRWVAGLHTPGKAYLARAENIARYSAGRWQPGDRLAAEPRIPEEPPLPAAAPLAPAPLPGPHRRTGVLLTEDDLGPGAVPALASPAVALAGLCAVERSSPCGVSSARSAFSRQALLDGLARTGAALQLAPSRLDDAHPSTSALEWALDERLDCVLVPCPPQGPAREQIDALGGALAAKGIALSMPRRAWDEAFWPLATGGFFKLRRQIPGLLERLGVTGAALEPTRP